MYNNMQKHITRIHLSFSTVFIAEDGCVTALSGNRNETYSYKRIYALVVNRWKLVNLISRNRIYERFYGVEIKTKAV